MVLLVDKFRPGKIEDLTIHEEISSDLKNIAISAEELPHIIMYGPRGSGKMTRIRVLLQEIFDQSINKIKIEEKAFQTPSGKKIEMTIFSSNYHIEINPSDVGIYDRVVIQETIKELAQTQQVDKSKKPFKVAVILEADRLTKDAQHALRRTMEKFSSNMRLILCCNSTGRLIGPIKSRCLLIRVPGASIETVSTVLKGCCQREGLRISDEILQKVSENSKGNIRKALLDLEAHSTQGKLEALEWEMHIHKIASIILKEQSPASLLSLRPLLYDLLSHCIPASVIIKRILLDLLQLYTDQNCHVKLAEAASLYESRLTRGSKPIYHLEAFCAKVMSIVSK